jgi:hypothetical protein
MFIGNNFCHLPKTLRSFNLDIQYFKFYKVFNMHFFLIIKISKNQIDA